MAPRAGDELVLALGNRSATLYQLGEVAACLDDISLALELGYPAQLLYKLYDRRARCCQVGTEISDSSKKAFYYRSWPVSGKI